MSVVKKTAVLFTSKFLSYNLAGSFNTVIAVFK